MFTDNSVTDAQTQARSLTDFLCRQEGTKKSLGIQHPWTVITEQDLRHAVILSRLDHNLAGLFGLPHSVVRIIKNVEKYLLQLVGIANDVAHGRIKVLHDL